MTGRVGRPKQQRGSAELNSAGFPHFIEVGQGDLCVSKDHRVVMTATLGSCVAVILMDGVGRACGMTHIFRCVDPGPTGGAAVVSEIEKLVNALMQAGSPRVALEARLVGGAKTLTRGRDVGGDIGRICVAYLLAERIPLTWTDIGGTRPRRIKLFPTTGEVLVSHPGFALPQAPPPVNRPPQEDTELF